MKRHFFVKVIIEDIHKKPTPYPHINRCSSYSEALTFSFMFFRVPGLKIQIINSIFT